MINQDDPLYPFISREERQDLVRREAEYTGLPHEEAAKAFVQMSVYGHGLAAVRAAHKAEFTVENMAKMIADTHEMTLLALRHCMEKQ